LTVTARLLMAHRPVITLLAGQSGGRGGARQGPVRAHRMMVRHAAIRVLLEGLGQRFETV
jgi:hypothetical protein